MYENDDDEEDEVEEEEGLPSLKSISAVMRWFSCCCSLTGELANFSNSSCVSGSNSPSHIPLTISSLKTGPKKLESGYFCSNPSGTGVK